MKLWQDYNVELNKDYGRFAQSGEGSRHSHHIIPFVNYLKEFINANKISSMIEGSSGHWRSGWQSRVDWPNIKYCGVDINQSVFEDNCLLLSQTDDKFGFLEARFEHGNILEDDLPEADLFLCKDTLIHFSNDDIRKFLENQILSKPRKYKYLMCVNNVPSCDKPRQDTPTGGFSAVEISREPFNMPVSHTFRYRAFGSNKLVEILPL